MMPSQELELDEADEMRATFVAKYVKHELFAR